MKTSDSLLAPPRGELALDPEVEHARLLAAIAKGDEQALGAFYDATVSRVYGLALRIVRQREAAEEVVVLEGELHIGSEIVRSGDFHLARRGVPHGDLTSPTGALFYIRTGARFKFTPVRV